MLQNSETSIYKHAYYERGVALRDVMYAHGNAGKNNMQKDIMDNCSYDI